MCKKNNIQNDMNKKISLFGKQFGKTFFDKGDLLFKILEEKNIEVSIYRPFFDFLKNKTNINVKANSFFDHYNNLLDSDLLFCVGGDGTFLEAVTYVRNRNIPIVGINSGRLGFLADISIEELHEAINEILNGQYFIRKVEMLTVNTQPSVFGDLNFALNELAIHKCDSSSMITIHAYINGNFLNSYWGDGLIIANPTGSTAYSLSAGGPILHPECKEFIISPIAPHNLSVRPLVVPNNVTITLKVESRKDQYMASLDLRSQIMDNGIEIEIKKADFTVNVAERMNYDFYSTLRSKLMWGADKRN
jgi:NAD+ kinase